MLSKAKYDSSPARPIHRSRQGCRRIPATHSPHPLRQENQVPPPHPLPPICVLTETSKQGKSPQAGMHAGQGRNTTSPLQHAAMTNARHCKAQRSVLHEPTHRTTFFFPSLFESPRSTFHFALFTLNFPKGQLCTLHFALFTLHFSLFTSRRDHFSLCTFHSSLPKGTALHFALFTLHFPQGPLFTLHFSLLTSRRNQAGATHLLCRPCRVSVMYEMVNACACWHA